MAVGKLLDYSQARPPLGKVKANGYSAVYRYVCSDGSEHGLPGKRLTPAERDAILHAGLDIGLHGEDDAGAAKLGYTRGKQQAQVWADYAHTVLAAPKGMTIVAAIDYDTAGTYPTVVSDYLHGVRDGLQGQYQAGVYGSIYVVDAALAEHAAVHGVQTNAWSHGKVSAWAHVYQHGPSEFPGTDFNDVLRVPHGAWMQTLNGDDMFEDADRALLNRIGQLVHTNTDGLTGALAALPESTATRTMQYLATTVQRVIDVQAKVGALSTGTVDPAALAAALATDLGPGLSKQLLDALAQRLDS
jgi:hypothetical protein